MEVEQAMKIRLDRYILSSILKVGIAAMLLCTLILTSIDLISNLENYIQLAVPLATILLRTSYYVPEAILLSIGPAFLFSITYFLSMLQANNEMICLLNSGVAYYRIIRPIILLAFAVSAFFFLFNETVGIEAMKAKQLINDKIFLCSSSYDNRNVTLNDRKNGYLLFARRYYNNSKELSHTVLIKKDSMGRLAWKMDSQQAVWDVEKNNWLFSNNSVYVIDDNTVNSYTTQSTMIDDLDISVELFRNTKTDIKTMELELAISYLKKIEDYDHAQFTEIAAEFYQRLFSCFTPFVLMLIACSINYRFKKNVLLFSIISCLCIGVLYYVTQMLTLIMANQGMISPASGMLVPLGMILLLSIGLTSTFRT